MLQIITGKFFKSPDRHVHPGKGILYSNVSTLTPIECEVGILEPVESSREASAYVFSYTNQIEKGGILVRTGDADIVQQFAWLASWGLGGYFSVNREQVLLMCRHARQSQCDQTIPSSFIPRFLEKGKNADAGAVAVFPEVVARVMALPRSDYLRFMAGLKSLNDAIQALSYNVDLSYSMLVYCLEALCQDFDDFTPGWSDYDEAVRTKLDDHLGSVDDATATAIRDSLLDASNLRLQRRFVTFTTSCLDDSFHKGSEGHRPIRKSALGRALRNAYSMRSKYVHALRPIQEQLRDPVVSSGGDAFQFGGEPYLTLSGLFRVTQEVLRGFLGTRQEVETENINWRQHLPGIVSVEMAPQYWIWKVDTFRPEGANQRLAAFIEQMQTAGSITNIADLCVEIQKTVSHAKKTHRPPMLALYWLFNATAGELSLDGWDSFLMKYEGILDECSIQMMAARIWLGIDFSWSFTECDQTYGSYAPSRFAKSKIRLPDLTDATICCQIANLALAEGNRAAFQNYIEAAIHELGRLPEIQDMLANHLTGDERVDIAGLVRPSRDTGDDEQSA